MQAQVPAVLENWIDALKQCRQQRNLQHAKRIHAHMRNLQLDTHPVLANYLISTLAGCGGLSQAQRIFDGMPPCSRNQHSWNSLITGYIQCGEPQHAFRLYHKMQQAEHHVQPGRITYLALFGACARLKDTEEGKGLHAEIILKGLEKDIVNGSAVVGNTVVNLYGKCGSLLEAIRAFNFLPIRDTVSWNALIAGYAEHGLSEEAVRCSQKMLLDGVSPDSLTFVCMLKACSITQALETVQELHSGTTKRGLERELYVSNMLVEIYCKCGSLAEARDVFDKMPGRDVISWATLSIGYTEHGLGKEVGKFLQRMQLEGISPDSVTFVCSLKACGTIYALDMGQELHTETAKRGLEGELHVGNMLLDMYCKCGLLAEACQVIEKLQVRDAVSWSAIIAGYVEHGLGEEARNCFRKMLLERISPDCFTFVCSLKACGTSQDICQELYAEASKRGMERELHFGSLLVDIYAECGFFAEARQIFDGMRGRDVVSWNALISGYAQHGLDEEAKDSFKKMLLEGMPPDPVTFVSMLKASETIQDLEAGRQIHNGAAKMGIERELHVGNTLLSFYGECGSLAEARQVFDSLAWRDASSWAALMTVYAQRGLGENVDVFWQQTKLERPSPDAVIVMSSLNAYGSTGALETGRDLHAKLTAWGMEREPYLGSILVDLYSRCGSLAEARRVLKGLSVRDVVSWAALLAGYVEHGLSKEATDCLQEMHSEGLSPDSVIFNFSLKACGRALDRVQVLHAEITKRALESELQVGNRLVNVYTECGLHCEAYQVFDKLPFRNVVSWNAVVAGYAEYGQCVKAVSCLQKMLIEGTSPDCVTLTHMLRACSKEGSLETGQQLHSETVSRGLERELHVACTLVDMYTQCKSLTEAGHVFGSLPAQDEVSWNALIAGYAEHGLGEEAVNCFQQMFPEGISPHSVTFLCSLKACCTLGALETGREIHTEITKRGLESEVEMANILVDMYGEGGSLIEARQVFGKLRISSIVSWNAMIKAYGKNHEGCMALQCFESMQVENIKPNSVTFISLLAACRYSSLVMEGWKCFEAMTEKHGIKPMVDHYTCMVDLFARSGQLYEAEKLVAAMQSPPSDTILYSLLSACKIHGKVEEGHRCFQQLLELNCEDSSAYVQMVEIYANAGRWGDANMLEQRRKLARAKKKPGSAFMEVNKELYEFVVGVSQSGGLLDVFKAISLRSKGEGFVPSLDLVWNCATDE